MINEQAPPNAERGVTNEGLMQMEQEARNRGVMRLAGIRRDAATSNRPMRRGRVPKGL